MGEERRPSPKGEAAFLCLLSPICSPGEEEPEQAAPLSGAPTKNRDSTLCLALSDCSMNTESECVKTERGRGEEEGPEERHLTCINVRTQAHSV